MTQLLKFSLMTTDAQRWGMLWSGAYLVGPYTQQVLNHAYSRHGSTVRHKAVVRSCETRAAAICSLLAYGLLPRDASSAATFLGRP